MIAGLKIFFHRYNIEIETLLIYMDNRLTR